MYLSPISLDLTFPPPVVLSPIAGGLRTRGRFKRSDPDQPLVSVITAVLNGARDLERSIVSVIGQTYRQIEFIIVDGKSTDATIDVIERYDGSIDYWISEHDRGIYDAWNKGVALANGEWIAFLGAGDAYKPTAVASYVETLIRSRSPVDLISSRVNLMDENTRSLRHWGRPFDWRQFQKAMSFAHVGALHHRSLFERFGTFDISYRSAGDYEFFMRCGKDLRALFLDAVTADVSVGGISMGEVSLRETCAIQKRYGSNSKVAEIRFCIAKLKRKLRPFFKGY